MDYLFEAQKKSNDIFRTLKTSCNKKNYFFTSCFFRFLKLFKNLTEKEQSIQSSVGLILCKIPTKVICLIAANHSAKYTILYVKTFEFGLAYVSHCVPAVCLRQLPILGL